MVRVHGSLQPLVRQEKSSVRGARGQAPAFDHRRARGRSAHPYCRSGWTASGSARDVLPRGWPRAFRRPPKVNRLSHLSYSGLPFVTHEVHATCPLRNPNFSTARLACQWIDTVSRVLTFRPVKLKAVLRKGSLMRLIGWCMANRDSSRHPDRKSVV